MTNPTSNFGWQMPTSTDLVTDLPADFETFGQAVDTSLADLKGGTTGQILSKASNTNMDFTWVTTDDANAIQNSIVDAKGDIVAASANDTPARLAVGANGETLVADSSTSTGLNYTAGTVQSNPVLNSAMQLWARGTSFAVALNTTTYTADRWCVRRGTAGETVSRQVTGDTTNLPNIQYCARVQRDSGNTSTQAINISQSLETVNSIPYAGKTVTVSYYVRRGANYSGASNALSLGVYTGTGTDENVALGYTGSALNFSVSATLTTTWQRVSATGTIPATATELGLYINYTPVGTAGAADYFEVTGVQIDVGSVALPFRTYAGTIQGELAACQRYYWRQTADATAVYAVLGNGSAGSTTTVNLQILNPVSMRVAPSSLDYANIGADDGVSLLSITSAAIFNNLSNAKAVNIVATVTGATQFRPYRLLSNNSSSGYVGLSAEL
jgi:hypothetical protein